MGNFRAALLWSMYDYHRTVVFLPVEFMHAKNWRQGLNLADKFPLVFIKQNKEDLVKVRNKSEHHLPTWNMTQVLALKNSSVLEQILPIKFQRSITVKPALSEDSQVISQMNICRLVHGFMRCRGNVTNWTVIASCSVIAEILTLLELVKRDLVVCEDNNFVVLSRFKWK